MHPRLPYHFTLDDLDITQFDVHPLTGIEHQPVTGNIMYKGCDWLPLRFWVSPVFYQLLMLPFTLSVL